MLKSYSHNGDALGAEDTHAQPREPRKKTNAQTYTRNTKFDLSPSSVMSQLHHHLYLLALSKRASLLYQELDLRIPSHDLDLFSLNLRF
jgi:hypothetical protein